MKIYATVQYLRSSWIINYHPSQIRASDASDDCSDALPCQPIEVWCIELHADTVSANDLCGLMLWGKDHPSTLMPGRIIKSVTRVVPLSMLERLALKQ